jgi:hypothetical protein
MHGAGTHLNPAEMAIRVLAIPGASSARLVPTLSVTGSTDSVGVSTTMVGRYMLSPAATNLLKHLVFRLRPDMLPGVWLGVQVLVPILLAMRRDAFLSLAWRLKLSPPDLTSYTAIVPTGSI